MCIIVRIIKFLVERRTLLKILVGHVGTEKGGFVCTLLQDLEIRQKNTMVQDIISVLMP